MCFLRISSQFYFSKMSKVLFFQGLIFISLSLLLVANSSALEQEQVSDIAVLVEDESDEQRGLAIQSGLRHVLLRLSGDQSVLYSEFASELLRRSSSFLLQFSYDTVIPAENSLIFVKQGFINTESQIESSDLRAKGPIKVLKLRFDLQLLIAELEKAEQAIWDLNRPELMVWWVRQSGSNRSIISESSQNESRLALAYYSGLRSVALRFPLMDLRDQAVIDKNDLWGGFDEQIPRANRRYQVNSWIQGKSYVAGGKWVADWQVQVLGGVHRFTSSAESEFTLMRKVLEQLARLLSKEYAVIAAGESRVYKVKILGVTDLESYLELNQYLKRLIVVEHAEVTGLEGSEVGVTLYLKDSPSKLDKLLALDQRLSPIETPVFNIEDSLGSTESQANSSFSYYSWAKE